MESVQGWEFLLEESVSQTTLTVQIETLSRVEIEN